MMAGFFFFTVALVRLVHSRRLGDLVMETRKGADPTVEPIVRAIRAGRKIRLIEASAARQDQ